MFSMNFITICLYFSFFLSVIIDWEEFNSIFFKSSILVQMVLYISNSFSSSIRKDVKLLFVSLSLSLTLNVLTYPLILGNIKTNGLITLSKYQMKYLELFFVSANFEMTVLLKSTSQIFIYFFAPYNFAFSTFVLPVLNIITLSKKYKKSMFFLEAKDQMNQL